MGLLLGAALVGALHGVALTAIASRLLGGWVRNVLQSLALITSAVVAVHLASWPAGGAAVGLAFVIYGGYEWLVSSSDAAKTVVISRHTGRRIPPL